MVLNILAVITGWRKRLLATSTPSRSVVVKPETAAMAVRASSRSGDGPLPA